MPGLRRQPPAQDLQSMKHGTSQESPLLPPGILVTVRGERWHVVESVAHEGCSTCRLAGAAPSNVGVSRTLLLPFDRPQPVHHPERWRRVGRRRWVLGLRSLLASDASAAGLRGAAFARLDLLAYQLEPALAARRGDMRLLLADEVGLGKTVQAGFVLADLAARSEWFRALIVCPAGLCVQWQQELGERFGLRAEIVDLPALRQLFRGASLEHPPWERLSLAIASVDFVKRPEVLQGMARIRWDALVVDEAHLAALAPERAAAVNWLARRSRHVILLTATPHPGEPGAFEALCRIGRLAGEGPLVMFRRSRAELGLPSVRRVRVALLNLSSAERRVHAALHRYASRVWNGSGALQGHARLAVLVLTKRAASGTAPLLRSLERRLRYLDCPDGTDASQLRLPLGEPDENVGDDEPGDVLGAPGLDSRQDEIATLAKLVALARAATAGDTKIRALLRLLRRVREPAIVFTEYRDALAEVASRLPADLETAIIHGGLDRRERGDAARAFTSGRVQVLLATDAAAYGLNLQARCRLVIDLDLPWNPVRLEQRIGRVDRIGQQRTVHTIHLVGRGTDELRVLRRLSTRARHARRALGDADEACPSSDDGAVLASLFERRGRSTSSPPRRRAASSAEATPAALGHDANNRNVGQVVRRADLGVAALGEMARLTTLRLLGSRRPELRHVGIGLEARAPWWTYLRRAGVDGQRVLAVFVADVVDGRGALVEKVVVPVEGRSARLPAFMGTIPLAGCAAAAAAAAAAALDRVKREALPRLEAERSREEAIEAVVEPVPVAATQIGLFDRRALRSLESAREALDALADETRRRVEDLRLASELRLAETPRLVLVAVVRGA
jgi:superfamily II DNA or RNA helicase